MKTKQKREGDRDEEIGSGGGLGGLFKGLSSLVEKLADLAETGEALKKSGEFQGKAGGKELKGVYGFSVKVGLGGEGLKVEPFGNIHKEKSGDQVSVVHEVREPMVDVFEEKDYVLVIAEMPGVGAEDLRLEAKDDILTLSAEKKDKKYRKEILLPGTFQREKMTVTCNNGVVEIKCLR